MAQSHDPEGPIIWALSPRQVDELIEQVRTAYEVVMDLETTGLQEHAVTGGHLNGGVAARVVLAAFTLPQRGSLGEWDGEHPTTWVVPLSHPQSPLLGQWRTALGTILQMVVDARVPLVNQNVKFDARWVYATTGVDLSDRITWDTQIGSHLLDETVSTRLKERVPHDLRIPRWDADVVLNYPGAAEENDLWELGEYAARDTWWTWRLKQYQTSRMFLDGEDEPMDRDEVQDARIGQLARRVAMPTVASLTKIEQRGILLDLEWVRERLSAEEAEGERISTELAQVFMMPEEDRSFAPTSKWFAQLTERAVAEGALRVTALTGTGKPQWSKDVLRRQARNGSGTAQAILDQRAATKRAEYLRSWLDNVAPDGAIRATYHSGRVATGRLSSSSPNMQQVTKALRPAFIPRPGYVLADFDYGQIELRVAAFVSRSEAMRRAFENGDDLHRVIASTVTGKRPEDVTADERQQGKAANFGLLYLQSAFGFRTYADSVYGVELTEEEALALYNGFFETWDGLREWQQRTVAYVHRYGEVVSPLGRVRRLPHIWDGNPERVGDAERSGVNAAVQGLASDLMQTAAASIQGLVPGIEPVPDAHLVATVHDSIVAEVPEDAWADACEAVVDRMVSVTDYFRDAGLMDFNVPLAADYTVGTRWGLSDVGSSE